VRADLEIFHVAFSGGAAEVEKVGRPLVLSMNNELNIVIVRHLAIRRGKQEYGKGLLPYSPSGVR